MDLYKQRNKKYFYIFNFRITKQLIKINFFLNVRNTIIFLIFILIIVFINSDLKNSFSIDISNQDTNSSAINQSLRLDQRSSGINVQELNNFFYLKYNNIFIPISFVMDKNHILNNIIYIKDKKLILILNPLIDSSGNLLIQIPRNILDSKTLDNKDSNFTVLINNKVAKISEWTNKKLNNSTYTPNRELSINFGKDAKVIEIEGSNLYKIKMEKNDQDNDEINTNFQKTFPILYGNNKILLSYNIKGGFLKDINLKQNSLTNKTLSFFISPYNSSGNLLIQIPRNILDSKTLDNKDSNFTVLINNKVAKISEWTNKKLNNSTYTPNRELSINFGKDAKVIEIEGSNLYKNTNHTMPKKIPSSKPFSAFLLEIPIISIGIIIIIIILHKKKLWNIAKTFEIIKKSLKNRE